MKYLKIPFTWNSRDELNQIKLHLKWILYHEGSSEMRMKSLSPIIEREKAGAAKIFHGYLINK